MVTGIGVVNQREVLFVANDATVKGGTYFPVLLARNNVLGNSEESPSL